MSKRHPNPRLAKIHRNYTVEEVAGLFAVHKNTVRAWIKAGLPVCDRRRPVLILGRDLSDFLCKRRIRNKRPCAPHELYCLRCRKPRNPAGDMADFQPVTDRVGNLIALCPCCEALMYKRISVSILQQVSAKLDITVIQAPERLGDRPPFTVNSDLG